MGHPSDFFVKSGFAGVKSGLGVKWKTPAGGPGLGREGVKFQLSAVSSWLSACGDAAYFLSVLSV